MNFSTSVISDGIFKDPLLDSLSWIAYQVFICFGSTHLISNQPSKYTEKATCRALNLMETNADMKKVRVFALVLAIIVLLASSTLIVSYTQSSDPQVYVGVAFGGKTIEQAKLL